MISIVNSVPLIDCDYNDNASDCVGSVCCWGLHRFHIYATIYFYDSSHVRLHLMPIVLSICHECHNAVFK